MHQSFETPANPRQPPPAPTFPHTQPIDVTHGLKDTVGSHEVKTLISEGPANKLQRLLNAE